MSNYGYILRVHRHSIQVASDAQCVSVAVGAIFIDAVWQAERKAISLYFEAPTPVKAFQDRYFITLPTGAEIPYHAAHRKTVCIDGFNVFHVYEVKK